MIACVSNLRPKELNIEHNPQFEVKTISIHQEAVGEIIIIAVYRCPQMISTCLLSYLTNYLEDVPHDTVPTVILGDFNTNLLSPNPSTMILQLLAL